jgi:hypothetical protein
MSEVKCQRFDLVELRQLQIVGSVGREREILQAGRRIAQSVQRVQCVGVRGQRRPLSRRPHFGDDFSGLGHGRFTRAIERRDLFQAELALLAEEEPEPFTAAAVRWPAGPSSKRQH